MALCLSPERAAKATDTTTYAPTHTVRLRILTKAASSIEDLAYQRAELLNHI